MKNQDHSDSLKEQEVLVELIFIEKHSGNIEDQFEIKLIGWKNLLRLLEFGIAKEHEIPNSCKAYLFSETIRDQDERRGILATYLQNLEKILEFSRKLSPGDRDIIRKFSDKANDGKKVSVGSEYIFIMLE